MKNTIPILNIFSLLAVIFVNALANALPINGYNTGELSAMYPNLFVPAGFTFSIWGIIYLVLIVWAIYFLLPNQRKQSRYQIHGVGKWFILSSFGNIAWIFAWHYKYIELSLILMLVILFSLINAYKSLTPGKSNWIEVVPYSVYLGWISVATIANTTAFLVHHGVTGGESAAMISSILIMVAFILGLLFILKKGDIFFGLIILWAIFGIFKNQVQDPIVQTTWIAMSGLVLSIIYRIFKGGPYFWSIK